MKMSRNMTAIPTAIKIKAVFQSEEITIGMGPMSISPPACFSVFISSGAMISFPLKISSANLNWENIKRGKEIKIRIIPTDMSKPLP